MFSPSWLNEACPDVVQDQLIPITWLMVLRHRTRQSLTELYDLKIPGGRKGLVEWYLQYGVNELTQLTTPTLPLTEPSKEFGVNLIGFSRGELGLGEDLRMAVMACKAANIPFSVFATGGHGLPGQDMSVSHHEQNDFPYSISLFFFPGMEQFNQFLSLGYAPFHHRYAIGFWPWELETWPEELRPLYKMNDEIWAISNFVKETYVDHGSVPVYVAPQTVEVPESIQRMDFTRLGIQAETFVFCFVFSFNSSIYRKNPKGTIEAFKRAFQKGEKVSLLVKAIAGNSNDPNWTNFLDLVKGDPRIVVINESFTREDTLSLIKSADCFVSLHRSEGFGRGITEAMLLDVPCIVSNYSGNTDFCFEDNTLLVDTQRAEVLPGQYHYLYGKPNFWGEPSVEHAAQQMKKMFSDPKLREKLKIAAKKTMLEKYSAPQTARFFKERLSDIFKKISKS